MAFKLNNQFISIDRPFTAQDGTKYANLRDPAIRAALGVTEVADAPYFDQRFYWGVDNPKQLEDVAEVKEDGSPLYVQVRDYTDPDNPVSVDTDVQVITKGLKSQWKAQVKATAGSLLAQSDWMVIRKAERDVAIPEAVVAYRAAVLAEADRLETAIAACADVPELIAVVGAQDWPKAE